MKRILSILVVLVLSLSVSAKDYTAPAKSVECTDSITKDHCIIKVLFNI